MSTLRATNIKHESSATNQIVLGADGSIGGTLGDTLAAKADASSLAVMQVLSTAKLNTFSTTSTAYVDVTGLSVSITPSSASNKVLVVVSLPIQNTVGGGVSKAILLRGSTAIGGGTPAGSRGSANIRYRMPSVGDGVGPMTFAFLDSPGTTSATTYKIQVAAESGTTAIVGVSSGNDADNSSYPRLASTITVMEVAA